MGTKQTVEALVTGGSATAGPPLGPMLGPLGVNVLALVQRINEATKDFAGMKVPVMITVDTDTKECEFEIGTPTTSALIAKEAKLQKGSQTPGSDYVGELTIEQVVKIAKILDQKIGLNKPKSSALQVLGTCRSMGVRVDDKPPEEVSKLMKNGEYDDRLKEG